MRPGGATRSREGYGRDRVAECGARAARAGLLVVVVGAAETGTRNEAGSTNGTGVRDEGGAPDLVVGLVIGPAVRSVPLDRCTTEPCTMCVEGLKEGDPTDRERGLDLDVKLAELPLEHRVLGMEHGRILEVLDRREHSSDLLVNRDVDGDRLLEGDATVVDVPGLGAGDGTRHDLRHEAVRETVVQLATTLIGAQDAARRGGGRVSGHRSVGGG